MPGQWRRQSRLQEQIGSGAGQQVVANVFDAIKLIGTIPSVFEAGMRYKGAGALHLIASSTVATGGVDSIDFTGALTGAFNAYWLTFNGAPETDNVELWARFGVGGAYNAGAGAYKWAFFVSRDAATNASVGSTGDTEITLANGLGNNTGEHVSADLLIHGPASSLHKRILSISGGGTTSTSENAHFGSGKLSDATVQTDIQILFSSGQIAAGGTAALYGLAPL